MATATRSQPTKMTAAEFLALPYDPEKLPHAQLIDGVVIVNPPITRHQRIVLELARLLQNHVIDHPGSGEAGIEIATPIDEHNVYAPDLWWVPDEQVLARDATGFDQDHPPALVAEVRSPATWRYDVGTKKDHYEAAGVTELWLIDTDADTVLVFRRSRPNAPTFDVTLALRAGDTLTTPLIADLAIEVAALFDR